MTVFSKISVRLEMMRWKNCLMAALAALLAVIVASRILPHDAVPPLLTVAALTGMTYICVMVFLATGAGNVLNDYYDIEIDRINRPERPLPSGRISPKSAFRTAAASFVIALVIAFLINTFAGLIGLINIAILILYARKLKQTILWGNLTVAYLTGSTFLFGGSFFGKEGIVAMFPLFLLSFLVTAAREIVKDIEDIAGDEAGGAVTFPIRFGEKAASYLAAAFAAAAAVLCPLPYVMDIFGVPYLIVIAFAGVALVYALWVLLARKDYTGSSKYLKIAMFVSLVSFIAGIV